jgi:hypothetical protein
MLCKQSPFAFNFQLDVVNNYMVILWKSGMVTALELLYCRVVIFYDLTVVWKICTFISGTISCNMYEDGAKFIFSFLFYGDKVKLPL